MVNVKKLNKKKKWCILSHSEYILIEIFTSILARSSSGFSIKLYGSLKQSAAMWFPSSSNAFIENTLWPGLWRTVMESTPNFEWQIYMSVNFPPIFPQSFRLARKSEKTEDPRPVLCKRCKSNTYRTRVAKPCKQNPWANLAAANMRAEAKAEQRSKQTHTELVNIVKNRNLWVIA